MMIDLSDSDSISTGFVRPDAHMPHAVRYTGDLFAKTQPAASERVTGVLDAINAKSGRNTLRPGRVTTAPAGACGER